MGLANNETEVNMMTSLRELRAERLLSMRELARQASVAPSTIFLIESGRTIPRQRVARQIAQALGVDPSQVDEFRRRIEVTKQGRGLQADPPAPANDGPVRSDAASDRPDRSCAG